MKISGFLHQLKALCYACIGTGIMVATMATIEAATPGDWTIAEEMTHRGSLGTAHLWVPENAGNVRAILLCVDNYAEAELVKDPVFRDFLSEQKIALLFLRPRIFGVTFDVHLGDADFLQSMLNTLAVSSGFVEIQHAPLITFGHSAAAPWAMQMAYWNPQRVAGVIYFKSGSIANFDNPSWATGDFAEVPMLAIIGELEEFGPNGTVPNGSSREAQWWSVRDDLLALRATGHRVAMAVMPGEGHWAWSHRALPLMQQFIADVMATRLPPGQIAGNGPLTLNVTPLTSGILMDSAIKDPLKKPTAPWASYTGSTNAAFWLPSAALASLIDEQHNAFGRSNQSITWGNLSGSALDRDSINGSWDAIRQVLTVSANASSGLPVKFKLLRGAAVQISPNQFRVNAALAGYTGIPLNLDILAYQEGNSSIRFVDRMARANVSVRGGSAQTLTTPFIANRQHDDPPFAHGFTASSGLTPDVEVVYGPAVVENGLVHISGIPAGTSATSFEIKLRARQWGNLTFATSAAATVTFTVTAPPPVSQEIPSPSIQAGAEGVQLLWNGHGRTFSVEVSDDLSDWNVLTSGTELLSGNPTTVTDESPLTVGKRFYRIVLNP